MGSPGASTQAAPVDRTTGDRRTRRTQRPLLGLDFDGTMIDHSYPRIGEVNPHAVECVLRLIERGWDVVLFTARGGEHLEAALSWCEERFVVYAVNTNPHWPTPLGEAPGKPHFDMVVDDTAAGTPLLPNGCVDWLMLWPMIERRICG
jgi:hypothetical protein